MDGIPHLLTPQLFQSPNGFNIIDFYEGGWMNITYEIDEQHYVWHCRTAPGIDWQERFGTETSRHFVVNY